MGIVDEAGNLQSAGFLNGSRELHDLVGCLRFVTVGVYNEPHLIASGLDLVPEARQDARAHGVAADINDVISAVVDKEGLQLAAETGNVHPPVVIKVAGYNMNALSPQHFRLLTGTEIRIDDIHIRHSHRAAQLLLLHGVIDGTFGFSTAVVAYKNMDLCFHTVLLSFSFLKSNFTFAIPIIVFFAALSRLFVGKKEILYNRTNKLRFYSYANNIKFNFKVCACIFTMRALYLF